MPYDYNNITSSVDGTVAGPSVTNITGAENVVRSGNMFSTETEDTLGVEQNLPRTHSTQNHIG
jgi:hypothetical protein